MKVKVTLTFETDLDAPTLDSLYEGYGSVPAFVDCVWQDGGTTVQIEATE